MKNDHEKMKEKLSKEKEKNWKRKIDELKKQEMVKKKEQEICRKISQIKIAKKRNKEFEQKKLKS